MRALEDEARRRERQGEYCSRCRTLAVRPPCLPPLALAFIPLQGSKSFSEGITHTTPFLAFPKREYDILLRGQELPHLPDYQTNLRDAETMKNMKLGSIAFLTLHLFLLCGHLESSSGFGGDTMHMARLWDASRSGRGEYSLESLSAEILQARIKKRVGQHCFEVFKEYEISRKNPFPGFSPIFHLISQLFC